MIQVGDRIRLMSGREEGTVTRVLENGDVLEVAIDGEFTIPLRRSDVVPIDGEEIKAFGARPAPPPIAPPRPGSGPGSPGNPGSPKSGRGSKSFLLPPPKAPATSKSSPVTSEFSPVTSKFPPTTSEFLPATSELSPATSGLSPVNPKLPPATSVSSPATRSSSPATSSGREVSFRSPAPVAIGTFLVLIHQAEELLAVQLVNNADDDLLYTYGEEKQEHYLGRKNGHLGPRAAVVLAHLHLRDFETWPAVVVQYLSHRAEAPQLHALETARVRFKAATFYNSRGPAPILKQEGYVFRLAEHRLVTAALLPSLDAALLADKLNSPAPAPNVKMVAPPHEVDLHLEHLADAPEGEVNNTEALRLQMAAFQDALDRAIATSMHEIIFIHGVGSGTLRKEIHRALSRDARIKFFEEAQKEKFGFGATKVRLK